MEERGKDALWQVRSDPDVVHRGRRGRDRRGRRRAGGGVVKCCVDVVFACDGEALDCGYCVDHHPHLGTCPDGLPDPPEARP